MPHDIGHLYLTLVAGWSWVPIEKRVRQWDLPSGRIIVSLHRHLVCLVDNIAFDTCDYWRGRRHVVGFYQPKLN
jgi:hypothetical protein